jgi:hypothetical protein
MPSLNIWWISDPSRIWSKSVSAAEGKGDVKSWLGTWGTSLADRHWSSVVKLAGWLEIGKKIRQCAHQDWGQ